MDDIKITEISYSFTQNIGNYQGQKLGATASVLPGQDPEEIFIKLQNWVIEHLPKQ